MRCLIDGRKVLQGALVFYQNMGGFQVRLDANKTELKFGAQKECVGRELY